MSESNTQVSIEQRKLLDLHLSLVIEENKTTNLTRITDWESAQVLHVEDSLVGIPEINNAPEGPYLDMGTGAGYSGIPAAIMTGRETTLADSVGKKTKALDRIIEKLGLHSTASTFNGRLEELALQRPDYYSVITARALSNLSSLLELASPLLKKDGLLVCYKSVDAYTELEHVKDISEKLGMEFVLDRKAILSDGETPRVIMVFKKVKEPEVKLPRRVGMAQKRPY
ncbi:MAG: RsmG family class I SAM-dependent methyltransferase [Eggerthellaceae bacterium]